MASIQSGRHYEIASAELAAWLDRQGADHWWNVDGDPLLTGRLPFPCPGDELAAELRKINRPLLVEAREYDPSVRTLDASNFGRLTARYLGNPLAPGPVPENVNDRVFYLCWKGSPHEWLLAEDSVTAKQMGEDATAKSKQEQ